jgi:hypothetical protein
MKDLSAIKDVSIIINGIKYDLVENIDCMDCELQEVCKEATDCLCFIFNIGNAGFKKG